MSRPSLCLSSPLLREKWAPLVALLRFLLGQRHLQSQLRHKIIPSSVNSMMNNDVLSFVCVLTLSLCVTYACRNVCPRPHSCVRYGAVSPCSLIHDEGLTLSFSEFAVSGDLYFFPYSFPHFTLAGCKLKVSWGNRVPATHFFLLSYI